MAKTKSNKKRAVTSRRSKTKMPVQLEPMLATLVNEPFDKPGWSFEVKWDGYRALAFMNKSKVELKSRNDKSFNDKFYPVFEACKAWNINAIVDGEIVVLNEQGKSDFGALQNWRSEADGILIYYVFDILWLAAKNLTQLPLLERKQVLKSILPKSNIIRLSESFDSSGLEFFNAASKMGLEGIIAKKNDSLYHPGFRSKEWLKIKSNRRQEMVIGGYTINEDTNKPFSALLVGVFKGKEFIYTGKIGTGFNNKMQEEMLKKFKPLSISKSPFSQEPDINKPSRFRPNPPKAKAYWLKPKLVCEVSFAELTDDGVMRHPSFEGLRIDKKAKEVVLEKEKPTKATVQQVEQPLKNKIVAPGKRERSTLLNPSEDTQVKIINSHHLKFNNLDKLYWPEEGITKRDMLNYYYQVAPIMLPYLKDRPQSMNRFPKVFWAKVFTRKM